jgi:hypothetical protein
MKSSKSTMVFLLIIFSILAIEDYSKNLLGGPGRIPNLIIFLTECFSIGFLMVSILFHEKDKNEE